MTWLNILSNSLVVVFTSLTKSFLIHNLITHFLIDNNVYLLNKTSSVFRHSVLVCRLRSASLWKYSKFKYLYVIGINSEHYDMKIFSLKITYVAPYN